MDSCDESPRERSGDEIDEDGEAKSLQKSWACPFDLLDVVCGPRRNKWCSCIARFRPCFKVRPTRSSTVVIATKLEPYHDILQHSMPSVPSSNTINQKTKQRTTFDLSPPASISRPAHNDSEITKNHSPTAPKSPQPAPPPPPSQTTHARNSPPSERS